MILSNLMPLKTFKQWFLVTLIALIFTVTLGLFTSTAYAAIDVYEFDTPQQETQYRSLIEEFRCPKCQNQNLAGSDSLISKDLKRKTYEMVMEGKSDAQIRDYMYERYGDFISYKPPVRPTTWILWFFPPLILVTLIGWWLWRNSHSNRSKHKLSYSAQTAASSIDNVIDSSNNSNSEIVESGLSIEESASLEALLKQHGSISNKNSDIPK